MTVDAFWRSLGVEPSGQQVVGPPESAVSATTPTARVPSGAVEPSLAEQLQGLARLHADGVLTDEEFASAKATILRS